MSAPRLYYRHGGHKFLTPQALLEAHEEILRRTGGVPGLRDRNLLESAAYAPRTGFYPTFFSQVAALGYRLTRGHPFVDGNKRTALHAMAWTLGANGYPVRLEPLASVTVMVLVATGHLSVFGLRLALLLWCGLDPADEEA
ncbi:type II toxin-antitoxin system death-on-curing family toxin [Thermus filiformis]|uniref:Death-on-curing protein n=1 Tax=Thermus filiformis TaxID=276 RepID=A0A0A2WL16_THEFI|nr:type II toxin-antitoxin system death-on-curing family toxin [Thermus filiformis]KGQ20876.2 death-on-curing protein [Thermus filiformis]